jgi:tight adherence protein B
MNFKLLILAVVVFAVSILVLNKILGSSKRSKSALARINSGEVEDIHIENDQELLLEDDKEDSVGEVFKNVPILGGLYRRLKLSGYQINFGLYMLLLVAAISLLTYLLGSFLNNMFGVGVLLGTIIVVIINNMMINSRISKRENYYLNNFPDALDMIVRSVKSGQPLLAALKMIAQTSTQPLAGEVQRVIDEVTYGSSLTIALKRMAERIGFLDMNFFVVILSVQQETGSNLSEVLTNLSNIIRKRKQLKLKIKALTAQSKMTTYIFSSIPVLQMGAIYLLKPDYIKPFTNTTTGVYWLLAGVACIGMAIFMGRRVSNLEV